MPLAWEHAELCQGSSGALGERQENQDNWSVHSHLGQGRQLTPHLLEEQKLRVNLEFPSCAALWDQDFDQRETGSSWATQIPLVHISVQIITTAVSCC